MCVSLLKGCLYGVLAPQFSANSLLHQQLNDVNSVVIASTLRKFQHFAKACVFDPVFCTMQVVRYM